MLYYLEGRETMLNRRFFPPDSSVDDDDLQFLSPEDRAAELGLEPPAPEKPEKVEYPYQKVSPVLTQKAQFQPPPPVPGYCNWRLAEVARSRGVINLEGPFRGRVSLTGIARLAGLAVTTVKRILVKPEQVDMIHMDTLSRLCDALECQPGDLLVYTKGRRRPNDSQKPTAADRE